LSKWKCEYFPAGKRLQRDDILQKDGDQMESSPKFVNLHEISHDNTVPQQYPFEHADCLQFLSKIDRNIHCPCLKSDFPHQILVTLKHSLQSRWTFDMRWSVNHFPASGYPNEFGDF
jgi:hypothetical protein